MLWLGCFIKKQLENYIVFIGKSQVVSFAATWHKGCFLWVGLLWAFQSLRFRPKKVQSRDSFPLLPSNMRLDQMLCEMVQYSCYYDNSWGVASANSFTRWMVGLQRIIERQNNVVITDRMWARLLSSTNQPSFLSPKDVVEEKKEEAPQAQLLNGKSHKDDYALEKVMSSACWDVHGNVP